MPNDPNYSTEQYAAGAAVPDMSEGFAGDSRVTEQYLLSLFRFVQYGAGNPNLTAVEKILLANAKDVFHELSQGCTDHTSAPPTPLSPRAFAMDMPSAMESPAAMEMSLRPMPKEFMDQSVTDWPDMEETSGTSKKKAKKKAAKKKTRKRSGKKASAKKKSSRKKSKKKRSSRKKKTG